MIQPDPKLCPDSVVRAFLAYLNEGIPPGGFVRACLENDLTWAHIKADSTNLEALPHIVAWLYWNMPHDKWRSREAVDAHLIFMMELTDEEPDAEPERDEAPLHDVSKRWDGGVQNRPGTEHNPEGNP